MKQESFYLVVFHLRILVLFGTLWSGVGANAQSWPSGVHDPSSMVKDGDTFWTFGTGDGIYSKYSTDMVTWSDGPTPFPTGEFPDWILNYAKTATDTFGGFFWAPDIIYMNNQYYLYYSCSVWGTMNSCIGLATNKTLDPDSPDYEWLDQGDIGVFSPDFTAGGSGWDVNAIDPAMMRGHDGKIWMIYGSFNKGGIMVTQVDSITGKPFGTRTSIANSWTGSGYGEGEGGSMFYHDGYYYLVYNKGGCCNGIASTYYMVIGRSQTPRGPFVDKAGKAMRVIGSTSGGTVLFKHDDSRALEDRYYGPGHFGIYRENGIDYVSFHYYNPNGYYPSAEAGYKGGPTLGLAMLKWEENGWPTLSFDFIEDGIYTITNSNSNKAMDVYNQTIDDYANLWQYPIDNTASTQKWIFKSLGTGEYTVQSYADNDMHLEVNGSVPRITPVYNERINQKFRVVKGADGKMLIYPSIKDIVFEIPFASTADAQIKLFNNTNHACQRWILDHFEEIFSVTAEDVFLAYSDTTFSDINISGNGWWSIEFEDNSWLEANPESGNGEAVLTIHAFSNQTDSIRTNKIFIQSNAGEIDTVHITQANNPELPNSISQITQSKITVYPNPTEGKVSVEVEDDALVSIYSSLGKRMLTMEINSSNSEVDISKFEPGIYVFEINTNNTRVQRMIIKN